MTQQKSFQETSFNKDLREEERPLEIQEKGFGHSIVSVVLVFYCVSNMVTRNFLIMLMALAMVMPLTMAKVRTVAEARSEALASKVIDFSHGIGSCPIV